MRIELKVIEQYIYIYINSELLEIQIEKRETQQEEIIGRLVNII